MTRFPTCTACGHGFTATEAEFAVEVHGRPYHAQCYQPPRPDPDPYERDYHREHQRDREGPFIPGTLQRRIRGAQ